MGVTRAEGERKTKLDRKVARGAGDATKREANKLARPRAESRAGSSGQKPAGTAGRPEAKSRPDSAQAPKGENRHSTPVAAMAQGLPAAMPSLLGAASSESIGAGASMAGLAPLAHTLEGLGGAVAAGIHRVLSPSAASAPGSATTDTQPSIQSEGDQKREDEATGLEREHSTTNLFPPVPFRRGELMVAKRGVLATKRQLRTSIPILYDMAGVWTKAMPGTFKEVNLRAPGPPKITVYSGRKWRGIGKLNDKELEKISPSIIDRLYLSFQGKPIHLPNDQVLRYFESGLLQFKNNELVKYQPYEMSVKDVLSSSMPVVLSYDSMNVWRTDRKYHRHITLEDYMKIPRSMIGKITFLRNGGEVLKADPKEVAQIIAEKKGTFHYQKSPITDYDVFLPDIDTIGASERPVQVNFDAVSIFSKGEEPMASGVKHSGLSIEGLTAVPYSSILRVGFSLNGEEVLSGRPNEVFKLIRDGKLIPNFIRKPGYNRAFTPQTGAELLGHEGKVIIEADVIDAQLKNEAGLHLNLTLSELDKIPRDLIQFIKLFRNGERVLGISLPHLRQAEEQGKLELKFVPNAEVGYLPYQPGSVQAIAAAKGPVHLKVETISIQGEGGLREVRNEKELATLMGNGNAKFEVANVTPVGAPEFSMRATQFRRFLESGKLSFSFNAEGPHGRAVRPPELEAGASSFDNELKALAESVSALEGKMNMEPELSSPALKSALRGARGRLESTWAKREESPGDSRFLQGMKNINSNLDHLMRAMDIKGDIHNIARLSEGLPTVHRREVLGNVEQALAEVAKVENWYASNVGRAPGSLSELEDELEKLEDIWGLAVHSTTHPFQRSLPMKQRGEYSHLLTVRGEVPSKEVWDYLVKYASDEVAATRRIKEEFGASLTLAERDPQTGEVSYSATTPHQFVHRYFDFSP